MHTTDTSHGMKGSDDAAEDRVTDSTGGDATTEESTIDELRRQVDERQSAYLRALADFQNFQRRAGENEIRAKDRGVAQVARALVPVLEQMDLALGHDLSALDSAKLAGAVDMIRRELLKALEGQGITRIEPKPGDEFDPMQHEAVMQQAAEGVEPGRIASCFQAGYRLGDTALRPAKVAVTPKES
jgi:molecular chaperone GrpE